ncbi:putative nuclease HARBI1 [Prorops nasuta]|uniref:putative nuclease HARBI1 n=1 Tax=Prorops nasuta TaxID=863751 RepID=UPI0034CE1247
MDHHDFIVVNEFINDEELMIDADSEEDEDFNALLTMMNENREIINVASVIINNGNESGEEIINALHCTRNNKFVKSDHYYKEVIPLFGDKQFQCHFRMKKETYMVLENLLRPSISDSNKNNLPLKKKILLTIWIISTLETFRSVADRFGVSKTTAYEAFKEVIFTLKILMPNFIQWPDAEKRNESTKIFQLRSRGFPGVVGAIDGSHIAIKQPPLNANDYYNRKDYHSIILQAICDEKGKFIDILIGRPGRAHDAAVFRSSEIYKKLTDKDNPLLPHDQHILGDSAYPLLQSLMTPFKDHGNLSPAENDYNTRHASIRSVIERAFALLKGKWRRLKYLDIRSVEMGNVIVAAACTLHNFLIMNDEINISERFNFNSNDMLREEIEEHTQEVPVTAQIKRNLIKNLLTS